MRQTRYTAELLAPIVASSESLADVIRKLGLRPTGGNHRMIAKYVRLAGLDTSHFGSKLRLRVHEIDRDLLAELVRDSSSFRQVLGKLGLPTVGRAHHELSARIRTLGLDTDHFTGPAWARGHTAETHPAIANVRAQMRRRDEDVFVENSPETRGETLRRRLLAMGLPYACRECGISEWQGRPLVLHVDHINGVNNDNRRENLRLLCPNCHSQTDTYCNRRRPLPSRASEPLAHYVCYMSALASVVEWQTLQS